MRINVAVPEKHVSKPVLDAALEAVTRLDQKLIASGESPTSDQLISAGARWKPEPPGQEHFDHGSIIRGRGHGDCDDWAPLHAATLRVTGEDPGARAIVRRSGPKRWHALVQRSDGTFDDPSIEAGMPFAGAKHGGVHGSWLPAMGVQGHSVAGSVGSYLEYPRLAMRPIASRDGQVEAWQARADLPWHWKGGKSPTDVAMVALHESPVPDQAVVGAVMGAFDLGVAGGRAHPEALQRCLAIRDACDGCPPDELAEIYGTQHARAAEQIVVGFLGLGKIKLKIRMPSKLRKPLEHALSKKTGKRVRLSKHATITPKDVLKSAAMMATVATTAGAGAALAVPTGAGGLGMIGADKLLAAGEKVGKAAKRAKAVIARTKALATENPEAQRALGILHHVAKLRSAAGIPRGEPVVKEPLTRAQRKAITRRVVPHIPSSVYSRTSSARRSASASATPTAPTAPPQYIPIPVPYPMPSGGTWGKGDGWSEGLPGLAWPPRS